MKFSGKKLSWGTGSHQKVGAVAGWGDWTSKIFATQFPPPKKKTLSYISASFGPALNRGVRVPLFSWFPRVWKFSGAKISAFSFSANFWHFYPDFTLFFLVLCLWPLTLSGWNPRKLKGESALHTCLPVWGGGQAGRWSYSTSGFIVCISRFSR